MNNNFIGINHYNDSISDRIVGLYNETNGMMLSHANIDMMLNKINSIRKDILIAYRCISGNDIYDDLRHFMSGHNKLFTKRIGEVFEHINKLNMLQNHLEEESIRMNNYGF